MRLITFRFLMVSCLTLFMGCALYSQQPSITFDAHNIRHQIAPLDNQQVILFTNLQVGETYQLAAALFPDMAACQPSISIYGSGQPASQGLEALTFVATSSDMSFVLQYPCQWNPAVRNEHTLSLVCQTCATVPIKDSVVPDAVLTVADAGPEEAIRDVLIGGDCFDITNITFCGSGAQLGTFADGLTNIGFNTGVILATGPIGIAPGPNNADGAGGGAGGCGGDSDLATLSTGNLFDVGVLEFDFTPTQSPVVFEYVFASEEYCEYVGSQFNDVFGFFISGPGIVGTQNIALIPATTIPVAINNVNHLTYSGFYVNNQPASSADLCGQTASVQPPTNEVQYDGYTRRFIASRAVQTCQTYHIKLAIGDVGDGAWDSAVFLKAGSFDAGGNVSVEWVVNGNPDATEVYEGCGQVQLVFSRVGGNLAIPVPVQYTITGTATSVLDYSPIPFSVVIPAGQQQLIVPVTILSDLILEGQESIIITLTSLCSCLNPNETLLINDVQPLKALPDTVVICGPGAALLEAQATGGVEPYSYSWNVGGFEQSIEVYANVSTNYRVTITDFCGKTVVQVIRVQVNPAPKAILSPPAPQLCPNGGTGTLKINLTGNAPFELVYSINNLPQNTISDITTNPYFLQVSQPGIYQIVSVTDSAGCQGTGLGALIVVQSTLNLTGVVTNPACAGQNTGSINTTVTGGQAPYTYAWTGPQAIGNLADPVNIQSGTYQVTVTDALACSFTAQFTVQAANPILPVIAGVQGTTCTNLTGGSINLEVTGGAAPLTYQWNNSSMAQDPQNLPAGTYTVTIRDAGGCTSTITAIVPGDLTPPIAIAAAPDPLSCLTPVISLTGAGSSIGNNFTYNWVTVVAGNITGGQTTLNPTVNQGGTYRIIVTNTQNGCTASADIVVAANSNLPVADAGPTQTLTCALTTATLNGTGSSAGNSNFSYLWTASQGGTIAGGSTTLVPIISSTGLYTLVVTDLNNGCTNTDNVLVDANITAPTAAIATPGQITCAQSSVTLNASGSSPSNVVFSWQTFNGNILSGNSSANPIVGEPGDYTVVVTNPQNGCTDDASVVVTQDYTSPSAVAILNGELNCITSQLTINGSNSSQGAGFTYIWQTEPGISIVSGANTLTPIVNKPGLYTLIITNIANNCTASASVQVTQNILPPVATPGVPATLNCTNPTVIIGNPNIFVLPGFSYQWTVSNGGTINGASNQPSAVATTAGTYTLSVTNSQNGCTNTGSVSIAENKVAPVAQIAPSNLLTCTTQFIQLNAGGSSSGPTYTTVWSTINGVISAGGSTLTPIVTSAGNYDLLITNNVNGCTATASTTILANLDVPTVTIAQAPPITCTTLQLQLNGTGTSTGPTFSYQWGTINGQITAGANTLTPTINKPGNYTLVVTNSANNCTSAQNIIVPSDITPPAISAGVPQILSCTVPTQMLSGTAPTGPQYTYSWTATNGGNIVSGANTLTPIINQPGSYVLSVTNSSNGCTAASSVQIQQDAGEPIVQIAPAAQITCADLVVTLDAGNSSTGNNFVYSWSGPGLQSGGTTATPSVNEPGNYILLITNTDNGCTKTGTVIVPENVTLPIADAGPDGVLNCFKPVVALEGPTMSTGANYTYEWDGLGIVSGFNDPSPIINEPGYYSVTVTNTLNGCTATDLVEYNADFAVPLADAGPGFELTCIENFYQTQPSASTGPIFTYAWGTNMGNFLTGPNQLAPIVNGIGFYYLTVTNTVNGCTTTDQMQITQSADFPTASAGVNATLTCAITELTLNGLGSSQGDEFKYKWIPTIGGNIVSGDSTLSPIINEPGTYSLAVTNILNSCISYSSVIVSQNITPPEAEAGLPVTLTCTTSALNLNATVIGAGNFSYNWSASGGGNIVSGNTTLNPMVNAVGLYTITVTNAVNGCTDSDQVNVLADQNAPIVLLATPDTINCIVNEVILSAVGTSTGNVTYTWSTPNGNIIDQSNPLAIQVNKKGVYQLLVTNLDNNCASLAAVQVVEDKITPLAKAGQDGLLTCTDVFVSLDGTSSSQNGNYFYAWNTPNGEIITGINSLMPTVTAAGSYILTVLNTDNGCSAEDIVEVNEDVMLPTIAITIPALITCFAPEVVLDGSNSSGGSNYEYAWTTPDGNFVSNTDANQAVVNTPGSYTLTVLNNNNGCANASTTLVSENTVAPNLQILPPATLTCSVPAVTITCIGATGSQFVYGWSTLNGNIVSGANSLNLLVDQPGTYAILAVNNFNGCAALKETKVIKINNVPVSFEYSVELPGCKDNDGRIRFDTIVGGIGPYVYSIDNGANFYTNIVFGSLQPGTYDLVIQDANGCQLEKSFDVPEAIDPSIDVTPEFQLVLGDSVRLQATLPPNYPLDLIDTIIWTPLDWLTFEGNSIEQLLSPWCKPFHSARYEVKIISKNGGCEAVDRVYIQLNSEPRIVIPNVFYPEDPTGDNSIFLIFADDTRRQIRQINTFQIFDRWGDMVFQDKGFQPNDPAHGWDGRLGREGRNMTPAVFVYYAEIELIDGRVLFYEGDVTLIR